MPAMRTKAPMRKRTFLSAAGCGAWVCISVVVAARTRALHYVQGGSIRGQVSTGPSFQVTARSKAIVSEAGLRNPSKPAVEGSIWTPLVAVAAACGLAIGMSFPSPSSAEMGYEEKAAVDMKWKDAVKQLSDDRDQEAKDAYLAWKDATGKIMEEYTKDMDASGNDSKGKAEAITTEKKAAIDAASGLPRLPLGSSEKDIAESAAGKKANEAIAGLAAAKDKVEAGIEGKRADAIKKANGDRDARLEAAENKRTDGLKKNEADKRAALSNM